MRPINEAHAAEPGLAVVEVAARWAIAPADRTTRQPSEPGVRLRCFLDLRHKLHSAHEAEGSQTVTG
ncbi:DUF6207 family protein [Streptomyces sp. NPDC057301]|uniref:DUF6207 family protein n=1 Tax=Streptomyces sp. NPDC057301 TaxID=3346093 RepID=UPI00363778D2